jgi:hypothetical protein
MDPPEFTSKALTTMAAAALIAMACVLWIATVPPPDVPDDEPLPATLDVPVFKLVR